MEDFKKSYYRLFTVVVFNYAFYKASYLTAPDDISASSSRALEHWHDATMLCISAFIVFTIFVIIKLKRVNG